MDYFTMGVSNIITFLFQDNLSAEWWEKIHFAARDVKQKSVERIKLFMNQLEMYLKILDIELDSVDVKSILYHALLPKYCNVFESKFENFNLNETSWHFLEEYSFQAELFHSFANVSSESGGLRKCYYCGKHGHVQRNCPSWRLKSSSEKTSFKRVPSEKKVPYEKQTLLQKRKCFNYQKTEHIIRDCPEKKSFFFFLRQTLFN